MSHIGAEVYVDLSEQTSGAAPGHTRLVVVVDEIERLKYASASVVLDAISRNDSKIDGK